MDPKSPQLWAIIERAVAQEPTLPRDMREWLKATLAAEPWSHIMGDVYDRAPATGFVEESSREYGALDHPKAWADLAHVLFNAKEFVFVE